MFCSCHLASCLFHTQGAILTTMLATRNFSSKYDAQGKYLRTPRTKKSDRNRLCQAVVWYGSAIHQNLLFISHVFDVESLSKQCFIPDHTSWYRFWSDIFILLHDVRFKWAFTMQN